MRRWIRTIEASERKSGSLILQGIAERRNFDPPSALNTGNYSSAIQALFRRVQP